MNNRVFLFGPPAVGCTHLLALLKAHYGARAACVNIEELAAKKVSTDPAFAWKCKQRVESREHLDAATVHELLREIVNTRHRADLTFFEMQDATADQLRMLRKFGLTGTGSMVIVLTASLETCKHRNRTRSNRGMFPMDTATLEKSYESFLRSFDELQDAIYVSSCHQFHISTERGIQETVLPTVLRLVHRLENRFSPESESVHPFSLASKADTPVAVPA
jgi:hypothetical protein